MVMLTPGAFEDRRGAAEPARRDCASSRRSSASWPAGDQLLAPAGRRSTTSTRRWPTTTISGRFRCARRAASSSIATAACSSRIAYSFTIAIVRERSAERRTPRSSASRPRSGIDEARIRGRHAAPQARPAVPADPDHRARDVRAGGRGHGARGSSCPKWSCSRCRRARTRRAARGASVRLRRRDPGSAARSAGVCRRSQPGAIVGQAGLETHLQRAADGHRRQRNWSSSTASAARSTSSARSRSDRRPAPAAHDRLRPAARARGGVSRERLRRRRGLPRSRRPARSSR